VTNTPFTAARPTVAAGALFLDPGGSEVLLVVPSYKPYLDLPGGYVEPGESPRTAARREIREELGISPDIGRLLVADWWLEGIEATGGPKLLLVFDGGRLGDETCAAIKADGKEVIGHRFHAFTDLGSVTIERLANRIRHAVTAVLDRTTRYLENGEPAEHARPS
jgi:8-oxo-dGTP pyrophosphatase MutT (NUDIX family)